MSRTTREDASTKILGHKAAGKTASRLARESAAFRELWWRRGNETELGGWRDGSIEENGRVSDEIFTAALETHGHLLEDAPDLATGLLAWAAWRPGRVTEISSGRALRTVCLVADHDERCDSPPHALRKCPRCEA